MGEFKESVIVAGGTDPPALTRGKSSESLQTQFTAEQLEAKTPVQKGDTYVNPPDAQEVTPVSLEERFPDALCIIRYSETFASDIKAASRLFSWKAHYVLDNFDVVHKYDAQGDLLSEIHPAYFPLRVMRGECGQTPEQKEPPKQVDSVPEPVPSVKEKGGLMLPWRLNPSMATPLLRVVRALVALAWFGHRRLRQPSLAFQCQRRACTRMDLTG